MANRPAPALSPRDGDRAELERWAGSDRFGASAAKRARIVLLAADGVASRRIAELSDATVTTVLNWRGRYQDRGICGLADAPRPGRPRSLDHRQIVAETLKPPPKKLGVTHCSRRLLADRLNISASAHQRISDSAGLAGLGSQTVEGGVVPVLRGPGVGRVDHRHLRAVPGSTTERDRAVRA